MKIVQELDTKKIAEDIVCNIMRTLAHPSGSKSIIKGDEEEIYSTSCELLIVTQDVLDKIGMIPDED